MSASKSVLLEEVPGAVGNVDGEKQNAYICKEYSQVPSNDAERRNLRERVSRLESTIETLAKELHDSRSNSAEPQSGDESSHHASRGMQSYNTRTSHPISFNTVTTLGGTAHPDHNSINHTNLLMEIAFLTNPATKDLRIRQVLITLLPQGESLQRALRKHDGYWRGVNYRAAGLIRAFTTFEQFAANALSRGSIYDIAEVAQYIAYGEGGAESNKLLIFIERFILADEEHMANLYGLNCGITHGLLANDRGQLRRAWQTWRKCIGHAQSLGLHRYRISRDAARMWFCIYSADRMLSLSLGRPHGIADNHCSMPLPLVNKTSDLQYGFGDLMMHLGKTTGRIIDHVQRFSDPTWPPMHELIQLEQELDHIASKMPPVYRILEPMSLLSDVAAQGYQREKLIVLLSFYRAYLALHIPYMVRSAQNPDLERIRNRTIDHARAYAFHFRTYYELAPELLWRSRFFDSAAHAVIVVLFLGIRGYGQHKNTADNIRSEIDLDLINDLMDIIEKTTAEDLDAIDLNIAEVLRQLITSTQSETLARDTLVTGLPLLPEILSVTNMDDLITVVKNHVLLKQSDVKSSEYTVIVSI